MNKSFGLLKPLKKQNFKNSHQTMEVNRSKIYSPIKKTKMQMFPYNKINQGKPNSSIEIKKFLYQQSFKKLDKSNKHKSIKNYKNSDINHSYKNYIINDYNIKKENSKTINNSKKNNYNISSSQKNIGSKRYMDLFPNNICNSNDCINFNLVAGSTISNSIYDKLYEYEINNTNSNDYKIYVEEMSNIINVLINYINIIK